MPTALLVGSFPAGQGVLEESYGRAFASLGYQVSRFDLARTVSQHHRLARLGSRFAGMIPDAAAMNEATRRVVTTALELRPELLLVFGGCPLRLGALAQLATCVAAKRVLVWPDTLVNLSAETAAAVPLYDLIACYGAAACNAFRSLGARRVEWVPLAADPALHGTWPQTAIPERYDVTFIGNWRPEREKALISLGAIRGLVLSIWGTEAWTYKGKRNPTIVRAFRGRPVFGAEFASIVRESRINLNIIDPTNYPSANMRFFEIPCAGGLEVSSPCPELAGDFPDGEAVCYYRDLHELVELVRDLRSDPARRARVAAEGRRRVLAAHTYTHRARQIVKLVGGDA